MKMLGLGVAFAWMLAFLLGLGLVAASPGFLDSTPWFAFWFYGVAGALGVPFGAALLPLRENALVSRLAARLPLLLSAPVVAGLLLHGLSASRDYQVRDGRDKVLVVGLDGATYDIIDPLIADGRLPNLARLIEGGASGELISIEPSISPALWTTMATGKLRSKHGIINFQSVQANLRSKRFWEVASELGKTAGTLAWLVTWPPLEQQSGFWVPSHMARGPETVPERVGFLQRLLGATREQAEVGPFDYFGWGVDALRSGIRLSTVSAGITEILRGVIGSKEIDERHYRLQGIALRLYRDLFLELRLQERPDLASVVFYGTDNLAHKYWRYFEPEAFPGTDPADVARYGSVITDYYEAADRVLGEIVATADERTTVLVVSDHGCQAMEGGRAIRMPRLAANSLLEAMGMAGRVDATGIGNETVVTNKATTVGEGSELHEVARLLREATLDGTDAEPFVVEHIDREGLAGDYVGLSFNLATELSGEDAFERTLHFPGDRSVTLADIVATDFSVSGGHHLRGIVIAKGRGARAGVRIPDASLPDVAPTILHLLGLPVARDMDGRVIADALEGEDPVAFVDSYGAPDVDVARDAGTESMTPELERQLRALGYLTE